MSLAHLRQTNQNDKVKVLRVVCLLASLWLCYLRKKGGVRTSVGTPVLAEHTKGTCNSTFVPGYSAVGESLPNMCEVTGVIPGATTETKNYSYYIRNLEIDELMI